MSTGEQTDLAAAAIDEVHRHLAHAQRAVLDLQETVFRNVAVLNTHDRDDNGTGMASAFLQAYKDLREQIGPDLERTRVILRAPYQLHQPPACGGVS